MPDSVVTRVADRLEIQPEQTDRVLRTLAQLIKKQSARDGRVHVPGLGVFQQSAETLVFEPDEALAEAVNLRYASLETVPLTLSPEAETEGPEAAAEEEPTPQQSVVEAFEEETAMDDAVEEEEVAFFEEEPAAQEEPAVEEEEEEAAFFEEEEAAFFEEEPIAQEEPAAEDEEEEAAFFEEEPLAQEEPAAEEDEEDASEEPALSPRYATASEAADFDDPDVSESAAYEHLQAAGDEIDDEPFEDEAAPGTTWSQGDLEALIQETTAREAVAGATALSEDDALTTEAEEEIEEGAEEEAEETLAVLDDGGKNRPPLRPSRKAPRRRSAWPWLLLVGAVLVTGAALLYQFGLFSITPTEPDPASVAATTPTSETPDPAATDSTASTDETPADEMPADETPAVTPPQETPAVRPPTTGRIDRSVGGFTLVVASLGQSDAEAEAARYRQRFSSQSIPVDVIQGESGGRIRYRVAVGQVPTVEEATALRSRLAADLPEGAWVTRITPDS